MAFAISFLSRLNKSISICVSLFSTPELLQSGHTVPTEHNLLEKFEVNTKYAKNETFISYLFS